MRHSKKKLKRITYVWLKAKHLKQKKDTVDFRSDSEVSCNLFSITA